MRGGGSIRKNNPSLVVGVGEGGGGRVGGGGGRRGRRGRRFSFCKTNISNTFYHLEKSGVFFLLLPFSLLFLPSPFFPPFPFLQKLQSLIHTPPLLRPFPLFKLQPLSYSLLLSPFPLFPTHFPFLPLSHPPLIEMNIIQSLHINSINL